MPNSLFITKAQQFKESQFANYTLYHGGTYNENTRDVERYSENRTFSTAAVYNFVTNMVDLNRLLTQILFDGNMFEQTNSGNDVFNEGKSIQYEFKCSRDTSSRFTYFSVKNLFKQTTYNDLQ